MVGRELETDWKRWGGEGGAANSAGGGSQQGSSSRSVPSLQSWSFAPTLLARDSRKESSKRGPHMCLDTWTCGLLLATAWLSQKASDLALSLWMAACAQLTLLHGLGSPGVFCLSLRLLHQPMGLLQSASSSGEPCPTESWKNSGNCFLSSLLAFLFESQSPFWRFP